MSKGRKRVEIDSKYKWDLTKIYKNETELNNDIDKIKKQVKEFLTYKNNIVSSSDNLYDSLNKYYLIMRTLEKLLVYSNLKYHEDMSVAKNQILVTKLEKLADNINSSISFFIPELLKVDYKTIEDYINKNNKLKEYEFQLKSIFRDKEHILDESKEEMLAQLGEIFNISENTFDMIDAVDIKFDDIKNGKEKMPLNISNYSLYMKSENRNIRKKAFNNFYKSYDGLKNTLASTLYGNIKTSFFISNIRKYESPLQMSLFSDDISPKLYEKLIEKVNNRININHDYMKLRKKVLKLSSLHMYDLGVPMIKNIDKDYRYEESIELIKKALSVLGKDYINDLTNIINSNCIDVYNNENKQTGAYSSGCYDTLPYILLNFEGKFTDVSTLAHELGHSMHTYYSNSNNKYQNAGYTIFLAEIASTVNEIILNKYCSDNAKTKEEKLFYLDNLLKDFKNTIVRQTMFAEFEKIIYDNEEKGIILTEEELSNTYYNLNKKYHGDCVISDEQIRLEWARIPHFYNDFYVYKYATGYSIACKIVFDIINNKENALKSYLDLLKSGGKDFPLNALKQVGIDILNDDTIDKALDLYETTINEFNRIYNE